MDIRPTRVTRLATILISLCLLSMVRSPLLRASSATSKQQSLDEWRDLTAPSAPPPRVFVKGDQIRFFFPTDAGVEAFRAHWHRLRVPTEGYRVNSAVLQWDQKLSRIPEGQRGWREATVVAGTEWRQLAAGLIGELTPETPGHGAYYQAFLADRLLYRDAEGAPRLALLDEHRTDVVIEHRFSTEETLDVLARLVDKSLSRTHPAGSLFLLMAPNGKRFTQPLLLDREQRQCVFLTPAALYDYTERGVTPSGTAQGLSALLFESHGLALIKNPVSSAARLVDLAAQTVVRFLRLPLPKPGSESPPLSSSAGMDLVGWEAWLNRYTGTRPEEGSIQLLIDGDQFFPRFRQAVESATNHLHFNIYIFDKDDVGTAVADQLKARSNEVEVKVMLDRMGTIAGGMVPPTSPLPEDFEPPSSIISYLKKDSHVHVRSFLNPWFSSDHAKVLIVDGNRAFLGGMNFGREYRYEWHDLMFELEGPVVTSLEKEFRRQWAHAGALGDLAYGAALVSPSPPATIPALGSNAWFSLRRLPTKTAWKPFATAVFGALRRAQNHIYVENPYLFDKRVILALVNARKRGVDVRVILPRVNDFKAGGRGNLVIANYLLERGVRVYFYPGMTHVKALLVDGWACLGSGNLNHLSLRLNQEQNIATSDPGFAARLKRDVFEADFARSYELQEPISVDWVDFMADLLLEGL